MGKSKFYPLQTSNEVNDKTYQLNHLDEFNWEFIQPAIKDKPEKRYDFVIEFGLHCFTRGLNSHTQETWQAIEPELIYSDSRENRIFCFSRYELSYLLPEIAKQIDHRSCLGVEVQTAENVR